MIFVGLDWANAGLSRPDKVESYTGPRRDGELADDTGSPAQPRRRSKDRLAPEVVIFGGMRRR